MKVYEQNRADALRRRTLAELTGKQRERNQKWTWQLENNGADVMTVREELRKHTGSVILLSRRLSSPRSAAAIIFPGAVWWMRRCQPMFIIMHTIYSFQPDSLRSRKCQRGMGSMKRGPMLIWFYGENLLSVYVCVCIHAITHQSLMNIHQAGLVL